MHTFTPRWTESWRNTHDVSPYEQPFRSAADLVEYAERDRLTLWRTWPETWHLDGAGAFHCLTKGSSLCDVRSMARDPRSILACRAVPTPGCPDNWVVLEHRIEWQRRGTDVGDADVNAFERLRSAVAEAGITLLDVVVVNDALQWWSLNEMSGGSIEWTFDAARSTRVRPRRAS